MRHSNARWRRRGGAGSARAGSPDRDNRWLGSALLAAVVAAPVAYPGWLALVTARRERPAPPQPSEWPGLSVVIAAYKEAAVIGAKIDDVRGNGYPGELEIIVVADDPSTAEAARESGARVVGPGAREGKAAAVNRGIGVATQPIVVISDADAHLAQGSLTALAQWFADPRIGAVAGEKQVAGVGQSLYWRVESWIKDRESRLGTTIGLVGELAAVRRSVFRPLPRDTAVDDLWMALDVIEGGLQVHYDGDATAVETGAPLAAEWERRTRTQAGLLDLLWRRRKLLLPWRSPVAGQLWGHKLLRSVVGPLAHAMLLARATVFFRRSLASRVFVLFHLATVLEVIRSARGAKLSRTEQTAVQILFLQATALGAMRRYLSGDRPASWPKPERAERSAEVFGANNQP
jgi:cellulose synthase/poly-beta-1,6-N-acetylglucosamine synthase-like glycosyltransferase